MVLLFWLREFKGIQTDLRLLFEYKCKDSGSRLDPKNKTCA